MSRLGPSASNCPRLCASRDRTSAATSNRSASWSTVVAAAGEFAATTRHDRREAERARDPPRDRRVAAASGVRAAPCRIGRGAARPSRPSRAAERADAAYREVRVASPSPRLSAAAPPARRPPSWRPRRHRRARPGCTSSRPRISALIGRRCTARRARSRGWRSARRSGSDASPAAQPTARTRPPGRTRRPAGWRAGSPAPAGQPSRIGRSQDPVRVATRACTRVRSVPWSGDAGKPARMPRRRGSVRPWPPARRHGP